MTYPMHPDDIWEEELAFFSPRNELAVAFDRSRREIPLRSANGAAAPVIALGLHAVVSEQVVYCPSTDAVLGNDHRLVAAFAHRCDAVAYVTREYADAEANGGREEWALLILSPEGSL